MKWISVTDDSYQRLELASRVAGCTITEVIERLTCREASIAPQVAAHAPTNEPELHTSPPEPRAQARPPVVRRASQAGSSQIRSVNESQLSDQVDVHVVYRGTRVEGRLDLRREALTIVAGPAELVGITYPSPSQAALRAVETINPARAHPETNGWRFWIVTRSGKTIESIRRARH